MNIKKNYCCENTDCSGWSPNNPGNRCRSDDEG